MALYQCECGNDASTKADACSVCGRPTPPEEQFSNCPFCKEEIRADALKCKHCGERLDIPEKSSATAGCLGFLLGPVGLWYKGHWAAGFAWLVMAMIIGGASGGLLFPFFWIGMAVHAAAAEVKR